MANVNVIELLLRARDEQTAVVSKANEALRLYEAQIRRTQSGAALPAAKGVIDVAALRAGITSAERFALTLATIAPSASVALGPLQGITSALGAIAGAGSTAAIAIMAVAGAAVAVTAGTIMAANAHAQHVVQLQRAASQAGITVNEMIDLRDAFDLLGSSEESASTALFFLNQAIERNDPLLRAIGADGLSVRDTFMRVVDALGEMDSKSRNAYGVALFGRAFREISGSIQRLAPEIRNLGSDADRTGRHISEAEEEEARRFRAAADVIKDSLEGIGTRLGVLATKAATPIIIAIQQKIIGEKAGAGGGGGFGTLGSEEAGRQFRALEDAAKTSGREAGRGYARAFSDGMLQDMEAGRGAVDPTQVLSVEDVRAAGEAAASIVKAVQVAQPSPVLRKLADDALRLAQGGKDAERSVENLLKAAAGTGVGAGSLQVVTQLVSQLLQKSTAAKSPVDELMAAFERFKNPAAIMEISLSLEKASGSAKTLRAEIASLLARGVSSEDVRKGIEGLAKGPTEREATAALEAQRKAVESVAAALATADPAVDKLADSLLESAGNAEQLKEKAGEALKNLSPEQVSKAGEAAARVFADVSKLADQLGIGFTEARQLNDELLRIATTRAALEKKIEIALNVGDVDRAVNLSLDVRADPAARAAAALDAALRAVDSFASSFQSAIGETFSAILLDTANAGQRIIAAFRSILESIITSFGEAVGQRILGSAAGQSIQRGIGLTVGGVAGGAASAEDVATKTAASVALKALGGSAAAAGLAVWQLGITSEGAAVVITGASGALVGGFGAATTAALTLASALLAAAAAAGGEAVTGVITTIAGAAAVTAGVAPTSPGVALVAPGSSSAGSFSLGAPDIGNVVSEVRGLRRDMATFREETAAKTININAISARSMYDQLVVPGGSLRDSNTRLSEIAAVNA